MRGEPVETRVAVNGVDLAVFEWPANGPAVVLCHATSFHARCWNQIVERLAGRACIALDFRGHGLSSKPPLPYEWRSFGEDLAALLDKLEIRGAIGVGHSMGGHAATLAAALQPRAFRALVLLDPVIRPRNAYTGAQEELELVLRRRNMFVSSEEMFDRFKNRPPFQSWDRAALWDYCNYGLLPQDGESFLTLACPPVVEASIYAHNSAPESNIYDEIGKIDVPVRVVRSSGQFDGSNFQASPTAPDLASFFTCGEDKLLNGVSHFMPMEAPELTAKLIMEVLVECGGARA